MSVVSRRPGLGGRGGGAAAAAAVAAKAPNGSFDGVIVAGAGAGAGGSGGGAGGGAAGAAAGADSKEANSAAGGVDANAAKSSLIGGASASCCSSSSDGVSSVPNRASASASCLTRSSVSNKSGVVCVFGREGVSSPMAKTGPSCFFVRGDGALLRGSGAAAAASAARAFAVRAGRDARRCCARLFRSSTSFQKAESLANKASYAAEKPPSSSDYSCLKGLRGATTRLEDEVDKKVPIEAVVAARAVELVPRQA